MSFGRCAQVRQDNRALKDSDLESVMVEILKQLIRFKQTDGFLIIIIKVRNIWKQKKYQKQQKSGNNQQSAKRLKAGFHGRTEFSGISDETILHWVYNLVY